MPIPASETRVVQPSLRETVYERLRDWIVTGTLAPAEVLRDGEVAERLGVSRTPVREALRRLEDEGLVETAKNRWTRVKQPLLAQAQHVYPIVLSLELLALQLALPQLSERNLDRMQRANRSLEEALEAKDTEAALKSDTAFHAVIAERSGNPELVALLGTLKRKVVLLERTYFGFASLGRESALEHSHLLDALRRHDLAAASAILETNWSLE